MQMPGRIVIVDFGMGNLNSVRKKISMLGGSPVVSSDPKDIECCDKLILPGVGHFGKAMNNLKQLGLVEALRVYALERKKPVLGICLGMQLFAKKSEEGNAEGLGWVDAEIVRFRISDTTLFKVPHIGWNRVSIAKESMLMKGIPPASEFYFVHSYYLVAKEKGNVLGETEYESRFVSAIECENIFGVQFHPEKSHDAGKTLLSNFIQL